jgi:hypothetical protein
MPKTTSEAGNGAECAAIAEPTDFLTGFAPISRQPVCLRRSDMSGSPAKAKLVTAAVPQGKDIPVYFQRVRQFLVGLVAARVQPADGRKR